MAIEVTETRHIGDGEVIQTVAWTRDDAVEIRVNSGAGGELHFWGNPADLLRLANEITEGVAFAANAQAQAEEAERSGRERVA